MQIQDYIVLMVLVTVKPYIECVNKGSGEVSLMLRAMYSLPPGWTDVLLQHASTTSTRAINYSQHSVQLLNISSATLPQYYCSIL